MNTKQQRQTLLIKRGFNCLGGRAYHLVRRDTGEICAMGLDTFSHAARVRALILADFAHLEERVLGAQCA